MPRSGVRTSHPCEALLKLEKLTLPVGEFDVDTIQYPGWDETPFKNLILPPGEKDLVSAFADRVRYSKGKFDDFVQRKGKVI